MIRPVPNPCVPPTVLRIAVLVPEIEPTANWTPLLMKVPELLSTPLLKVTVLFALVATSWLTVTVLAPLMINWLLNEVFVVPITKVFRLVRTPLLTAKTFPVATP